MKSEDHFKKAFDLADIGYWQLDLREDELYWSDKVKELHEVATDYIPTLEEAIKFYPEGRHRNAIRDAVQNLIDEGITYDLELKIITAKGNERWIRTVGDAEFDNGECKLIYGTTQDIDQRKRAQQKLKDTEERLRDIVEHSTNMFYRYDTNYKLTYVSPQSTYFLGKEPEYVTEKWDHYLTDHPLNKKGKKRTRDAIKSGKTQPPYEMQIQRSDGEILWVKVNEAPIVDDGETVAIIGSLTDITEHKEREAELEKLSRIARETQNMVVITDRDQHIQWVNQAFLRLTGYTFEEVKGRNPGDLLQGKDTNEDTVRRIAEQIDRGGRFSEEILNYAKDGTPYWINMQITPITNEKGEVVQFFSIQEEITVKKKAQAQLKQHNRRLKQAQRVGNIGDWWYDLQTGDITWSSMLYTIYDRDPQEGEPAYEEVINRYALDPDFNAQKIQEAIKHGKSSSFDQQIRTEEGKVKYVHKEIWPLKNQKGEIIQLHGTVQDITARKQAEIELKDEVSFSNAIINGIPGIFYMMDKDDLSLIRVNQYVIDLFDLDPENISNISGLNMIAPREQDKARKKLKKVKQEGYAELQTILKAGDVEGHYYMNGSLFQKDGKEYIIGIGIDITERVQTQKNNEVLLQEVHHRVKNNLAIISGLLRLELEDLEDETYRTTLERSINRIQSIAKVHELLYQTSNFSSLRIGKYISKLTKIVRDTFKKKQDIQIYTDIEDVEMNLNEAIPLGMLLNELLTNSMKYAFVGRDSGIIRIKITQDDEYYTVVYRDNGRGFKQKPDLEHADSLGLTIVNMLLKQLGTEYEMKTEDEFFITFRFAKKETGSHSNLTDL